MGFTANREGDRIDLDKSLLLVLNDAIVKVTQFIFDIIKVMPMKCTYIIRYIGT